MVTECTLGNGTGGKSDGGLLGRRCKSIGGLGAGSITIPTTATIATTTTTMTTTTILLMRTQHTTAPTRIRYGASKLQQRQGVKRCVQNQHLMVAAAVKGKWYGWGGWLMGLRGCIRSKGGVSQQSAVAGEGVKTSKRSDYEDIS
jgi:hypothetical protein